MTEQEIYVLMSDCPEIQGGWVSENRTIGDYFINFIDEQGDIQIYGLHEPYELFGPIFLPRQVQLQDMVFSTGD